MHASDPNYSFAPVQKTTLVESVMEQIIEQMRKGQLPLGSRLPSERALMAMMNVGRSTVREALQALAAMNLIETRSGEGSRVRAIPSADTPAEGMTMTATLQQAMRLQLLQVRELVEGQVALWAIENTTEADLELLESALHDYLALAAVSDWSGSNRAHHDFHCALAEASHNLVAVRVVDSLVTTVPQSLMQKYVSSSPEIFAHEKEIHQEIYEALKARDAGRMFAAIAEHMNAERRQIMAG